MKYDTWIDEENLRPVLTALGWINKYKFDNADWDAVRNGIQNVDEEKNIWFDYALVGEFVIRVSITMMSGSCDYTLSVLCDREMAAELDILAGIGQCYRIQEF